MFRVYGDLAAAIHVGHLYDMAGIGTNPAHFQIIVVPRLSPRWPAPSCQGGSHPGGNPGANLKSISHKCHLFEVAFVWELTKETIHLPLGCLQGGMPTAATAGGKSWLSSGDSHL